MNVTYKPETLVVTRDGCIDDEYYDALYSARRRAALHNAGRQLVGHMQQIPLSVGHNILDLLSEHTKLVKN